MTSATKIKPTEPDTMDATQPTKPPTVDAVPLCVDLDGSLLRTDMLYESLFAMLGDKPGLALRVPGWVLAGKETLKDEIASRVMPDVETLPYHEEVLAFLRQQKEAGRTLVLATASHQRYADAVAAHLGIFDHAIGTNATANNRGEAKVQAIRETVGDVFDYVGDSDADIPLVDACRNLYLVCPSKGLCAAGEKAGKTLRTFAKPHGSTGLRPLIKLIRPHQWAKNALIFVPMMMGHQINLLTFAWTLLGFVAFCATASSIYIFNDLVDIDSDRRHHSKRKRPLAAATVSIPAALKIGIGLLALGLGTAALAGLPFLGWVALYLVLTTAYSFSLKRRLLVDVILLGWLYTHRVIAGGILFPDVFPSQWLLAFCAFLFISLAFAKRYTELAAAPEGKTNARRGYRKDDLPLIGNIGPTAGFMALLVFSLYLNGDDVKKYYDDPWMLWLAVPVLMFWILRVWFLAYRHELHEDPIAFAIRDKVSYACVAAVGALLLLASL